MLGNASWNYSTKTLSWDASSNNLMDLPDLVGDWSEYTTIKLETSDLQGGGQFRLMVYFDGTAETITMYSAGDKDLKFSERFAGKDLSKVTKVSLGGTGSNSGSVVISKVYLDGKPMSLDFDEKGVAEIDITDLTASGCFSLDDQTGVLTSVSTTDWGELKVNLPTDGIDLSEVTNLTFSYTGDNADMISTLTIVDATNGTLGTFYSSKYVLNFTSYAAKASQVTTIKWGAPYQATKDATMTINSIKLTANVITSAKAGETVLNTLQYHAFPSGDNETATWNVGKSTDTYYGSGSSDANHYVDLTDYEELRIYRDNETAFRAFFINAAGTGTNNYGNGNGSSSTPLSWNEADKYYSIDLTQVEKYDGKIYLNTIKSASYGTNNVVNNITVYKTPTANAPQYILSGSGVLTASALAALADASATAIDATGITKAVALTTANPNCLIVANEGMVTNAQNVIVDGTCANLVLTDKKPFKAPAAFTATAASFEKTLSDAATMVLPFAATIPSGVKAYNLTGVDGDAVTAVKVDAITADQPVLLNGTGTVTFTGSNAAVTATAAGAVNNGVLYGVYADGYVPAGSYVLQNGTSGLGFYKVAAENTISVAPFRAYLTAATPARSLRIVYADETTGIESMNIESMDIEHYYDLQGRRVAQPTKGLYIVNGKKVMVK